MYLSENNFIAFVSERGSLAAPRILCTWNAVSWLPLWSQSLLSFLFSHDTFFLWLLVKSLCDCDVPFRYGVSSVGVLFIVFGICWVSWIWGLVFFQSVFCHFYLSALQLCSSLVLLLFSSRTLNRVPHFILCVSKINCLIFQLSLCCIVDNFSGPFF